MRYNVSPRFLGGAEAVLTFGNFNVPFARPEYVEGQRIEAVDLEWQYIRAGLGLGYRTALASRHQDNALELTLTYEPGFIWFEPDDDTASNFIVPRDTYEGRAHLRVPADALERNLMELAHQGYTAGADLLYGHRANWHDWGEAVLGIADAEAEQDYFAASLYVVVAGGVPLLDGERHRLTACLHMGSVPKQPPMATTAWTTTMEVKPTDCWGRGTEAYDAASKHVHYPFLRNKGV